MTADELRMNVGENIKFFRKMKDMTQSELAEKADLSVGFLCELEAGRKGSTAETLVKLADVFNIHPSLLFASRKVMNEISSVTDLTHFYAVFKNKLDSYTTYETGSEGSEGSENRPPEKNRG